MNYASACYTDDAQTIALDYLVFDQFSIQTQIIDVQKGYFVHITRDNALVADGIVASVQPNKETQEISIRPLQALFDVEVYYNAVSDAITWLATNIDDALVNNTDASQNRPVNVTYTPGGQNFPLTGYNFNATTNILSVIATAFKTWNVVTECSINMSTKKIDVNIYQQNATKTIECDLDNIFNLDVSLGDSYGSANKYTVKKTGVISGTTEITYYLHPDGSIDTTNSDRITPVFWKLDTLEADANTVDNDWINETATMAKEAMAPTANDNEVIFSVGEDDQIVKPLNVALGTKTTIILHGNSYSSIYTGYSRNGSIVTMTFGGLRRELTKQLSMQGGATIVSQAGGGSSVPIATTSTAGIVKPDGTTVTVDNDGTIHSAQAIATTAAAGAVKPDGSTITVDNDGTIHAADTKILTNGSHAWKGVGAAISTSIVLIAFQINEDTAPTATTITNVSGSLTTVGNASSAGIDTSRTTSEALVFRLGGSFTTGRAYFCQVNFRKS